MNNSLQFNVDLDTEIGRQVVRAVAGALGGSPEVNVAPSAEQKPEENPEPTAKPESVEKPQPEKPKVNRRRTKAQIEEDKADGVDDIYKSATKEYPDLDVDEIRAKIREDLKKPSEEEAPSEDKTPEEDKAPEAPEGNKEPEEGLPDWVPNWA